MNIPIISLWMPWANWVMLGWKRIETRTHPKLASLQGRTIGIHATQHWDKSAIDLARPYLSPEQLWKTANFLKIGGAILGTVQALEHRKLGSSDSMHALIDCGPDTNRWGIVLTAPRVIEAIPARGYQGIWYHEIPDPDSYADDPEPIKYDQEAWKKCSGRG
jgi:hypothetical protein